MKFKQATDALLKSVTLDDLAKSLGIHIQAVRQARAAEGSPSHRRPPPGWEQATAKLASARARQLEQLAAKLTETT